MFFLMISNFQEFQKCWISLLIFKFLLYLFVIGCFYSDDQCWNSRCHLRIQGCWCISCSSVLSISLYLMKITIFFVEKMWTIECFSAHWFYWRYCSFIEKTSFSICPYWLCIYQFHFGYKIILYVRLRDSKLLRCTGRIEWNVIRKACCNWDCLFSWIGVYRQKMLFCKFKRMI